MKLTPEEVLHEDVQPVKAPKRAPKEKPPKRERKKRQTEPEDADDLMESDDPGMDEAYEDMPRRRSKIKTVLLILLMALGFVIFVINMKGFIGSLSLEKNPPSISDSYDESYQDALDADTEDFEKVNQEREEQTEEAAPEPAEEPDTVSDASDTADTSASEDEVSKLKAEVERLRTEAENARTEASTMEQELNVTKSYLDASEAREAQLRSELDAVASGTK